MLGISNAPLSYTYLVWCCCEFGEENANAMCAKGDGGAATDGLVVFDMIAKYCIRFTRVRASEGVQPWSRRFIYLFTSC